MTKNLSYYIDKGDEIGHVFRGNLWINGKKIRKDYIVFEKTQFFLDILFKHEEGTTGERINKFDHWDDKKLDYRFKKNKKKVDELREAAHWNWMAKTSYAAEEYKRMNGLRR